MSQTFFFLLDSCFFLLLQKYRISVINLWSVGSHYNIIKLLLLPLSHIRENTWVTLVTLANHNVTHVQRNKNILWKRKKKDTYDVVVGQCHNVTNHNVTQVSPPILDDIVDSDTRTNAYVLSLISSILY